MDFETNIAVYPATKSESRSWKQFVILNQVAVYPVLMLLRIFVVRRNLYRNKVNITNSPHVLYSNHQSMLDPFLLTVALTPRQIVKLLPFRFFVANEYFNNPAIAFFFRIMGGFPAHFDEKRPFGLEHAKSLLASGQTVVIFPQGKRTREKVAKPGISVLASEPDIHLIPMSLNWESRLKCRIHVGEIYVCHGFKEPELLMDTVHSLPFKSPKEI